MRPIDADALPVCKEHCIDECGFGANFYVVHKTDIDAAPTITIEAEPVKHGRWVDHCVRAWRCSECGEKLMKVRRIGGYCYDDKPNYCPNCGCKMDLEE